MPSLPFIEMLLAFHYAYHIFIIRCIRAEITSEIYFIIHKYIGAFIMSYRYHLLLFLLFQILFFVEGKGHTDIQLSTGYSLINTVC